MRLARLPLLFGALTLALAAVGCSETTTHGGSGGSGGSGGTGGSGGSGGTQAGVRIYDLQDPAKSPPLGSDVVLRDVIVTAVVERADGSGSYFPQHFYVQDPEGGKYSGIYVRNGTDGEPVVTAPAVGDVVDLAGKLAEYFDRTQIEVLTLQNKGPGTLPAPAVVDPELVATGGAEQEAWEGVLVAVEDVVSTEAPVLDANGNDYGYFRVNTAGRAGGGLIVGNSMRHGYVRVPGDAFTRIVGVMDYSYEEARIEPRAAADILFTDGTDAGPREAGAKTVYQLQNTSDAAWPHPPATVSLANEVVVTASQGNRLWVQEVAGGPFSGIQVRLPSGTTAPAVGSRIKVSGLYTEYFFNAQIDQAAVEVVSTGVELPAPAVVETAAIRTGAATAEQWEGVLLRVENVQNVQDPVTGTDGQDRGDFRVAPIAGGSVENGVIVGHAFDNDYDGEVGDRFQSIVGVLDFTFSEFVLQPRGNEDITLEDGSHPTAPHIGTVSIRQLQDESHEGWATDVRATLEGVVVTASSRSGFFVQETSGDPRFSGIYVRIPDGSGLEAPAQGSLVTVDGKVYEYFDKTQLVASSIEVTGSGTIPAPAVVDALRVATGGADQEAYEGVLVEVRDVVNVQDPVLGTDGTDRGDFRVGPAGGTAGLVVGHLWPDDYTDGQVGDAFASLVGVMDFSFEEARLETRGNEDITFADGTHPVPPAANVVTIEEIQHQTAGEIPDGTRVEVRGVVVTGVGPRGFWVQTPGKAEWNGIYVFRQRDDAFSLPARGDEVTVAGTYTEYFGLSQIIGSSVTVTGTASVPAPVIVTPDEITGERAEALEGVLVEVRDVENTQDPVLGTDGRDRGDFRVQTIGGTGGVVVGNTNGHSYDGAVGDEFDSIVGLLDYSFDAWRIQPRDDADITFADGTHPGAAGPVVATVYQLQDETDPAHPADGTVVEVRNVVVTALRGGSFYVAEPGGGAYSGIYAFKPAAVTIPAVDVGDVVTLRGKYIEYVASTPGSRPLSEIMLSEVQVVSAGGGAVAPVVVTPEEIAANGAGEAYENCLVTVENVTVTQVGGSYARAEGVVDADKSDEIHIGTLLFDGYTLSVDQQLSSVTGIVDDYAGTYRLHPRGASDLVPQQ